MHSFRLSDEQQCDDQKTKLRQLLHDYEDLFDGTLGDWKTSPISVELKEGAKPYHSKPYPIPHIHRAKFKAGLDSLVKEGQ